MLGHSNPNTSLLNGLRELYRVKLFNKQVMLGLRDRGSINKHVVFVYIYMVRYL